MIETIYACTYMVCLFNVLIPHKHSCKVVILHVHVWQIILFVVEELILYMQKASADSHSQMFDSREHLAGKMHT